MKTIMTSHEEYCRILKLEVKKFTLEELYNGMYKTEPKGILHNPYKDYNEIYKEEIKLRE